MCGEAEGLRHAVARHGSDLFIICYKDLGCRYRWNGLIERSLSPEFHSLFFKGAAARR